MKPLRNTGRIALIVGLLVLSRAGSSMVELLPLIGLVMLGVAGWSWIRTRALLATAWNADGMIVAVTRGRSAERRSALIRYPRVRFLTITGEVVEFISGVGRVPATHRDGDQVTVVYNPRDPSQARI